MNIYLAWVIAIVLFSVAIVFSFGAGSIDEQARAEGTENRVGLGFLIFAVMICALGAMVVRGAA